MINVKRHAATGVSIDICFVFAENGFARGRIHGDIQKLTPRFALADAAGGFWERPATARTAALEHACQ